MIEMSCTTVESLKKENKQKIYSIKGILQENKDEIWKEVKTN